MWGFKPQCMDMYLSTGADFIQTVKLVHPETNHPFIPPDGSTVFFQVGDKQWVGDISGDTAKFKVESEVADTIQKGTKVKFCISLASDTGFDDWVITTGKVLRD